MRRVLLVLDSEDLQLSLMDLLGGRYEVFICNGDHARDELLRCHYDALVLDLFLPGVDGFSVLKQIRDCRPPVILLLTAYVTPYVLQEAANLGVGFAIRIPCTARTAADRLIDMMQKQAHSVSVDAQAAVQKHLTRLGISFKHNGYYQLRIGIPLFARDQNQLLLKELYPMIGDICGQDAQAVEHSIREAIRCGWKRGDPEIWREYFPYCTKCPSNKEFIATLSELL